MSLIRRIAVHVARSAYLVAAAFQQPATAIAFSLRPGVSSYSCFAVYVVIAAGKRSLSQLHGEMDRGAEGLDQRQASECQSRSSDSQGLQGQMGGKMGKGNVAHVHGALLRHLAIEFNFLRVSPSFDQSILYFTSVISMRHFIL